MTVVSRLLPLQERILDELAGMQPPWTLFGAGALIGFHLGHRTTRDLDPAFRQRLSLGLVRGLEDAAARDGGFSPPILAWQLQSFPIARGVEEGRDPQQLAEIRERILAALRA